MKHTSSLKFKASILALAGILAGVQASRANLVYHVDLNTSVLTGNAASPFSLDFQLTDGSGSLAGPNTVSIFNFSLIGGNAVGSPSFFGGASGSLNSTVTLTDGANFLNEFYQGFSGGTSRIGFDVSMTQNADPGGTPDYFTVAILDNTLGQIATTDPQGVSMVAAALDPSTTLGSVQTFSSVSPAGVTSSVPEPSTNILLGLGAAALVVVRRRTQRPEFNGQA